MKQIELRGKYAIGAFKYALVDDDDFERLNQHKWKAKYNGSGSNVYAIRTTKMGDKTIDIRMHRVVAGAEHGDQMDVDHINHNSLDNRKVNLRLVSRSQNMANKRKVAIYVDCPVCGEKRVKVVMAYLKSKIKFCGAKCRRKHYNSQKEKKPRIQIPIRKCEWCKQEYRPNKKNQRFCCAKCRYEEKNEKNRPDRQVRYYRECEWCYKPFETNQKHGRYCCRNHARKARYVRQLSIDKQ